MLTRSKGEGWKKTGPRRPRVQAEGGPLAGGEAGGVAACAAPAEMAVLQELRVQLQQQAAVAAVVPMEARRQQRGGVAAGEAGERQQRRWRNRKWRQMKRWGCAELRHTQLVNRLCVESSPRLLAPGLIKRASFP